MSEKDNYHFSGGNFIMGAVKLAAFAIIACIFIFGVSFALFMYKDTSRISENVRGDPQYWPKFYNNWTNMSGGGNTTIIGTCDDTCLIKYALAEENYNYCERVSSNNSNDCWKHFSDQYFAACVKLSTPDLRSTCALKFALSSKNESICSYLPESEQLSCKETITPPCSNVSEGSEKELCLAQRYLNASYCKGRACLMEYALAQGSTQSCDEITAIGIKTACMAVYAGTDKCLALTNTAEQDLCHALFGAYSNNPYYCGLSSDPEYRYECTVKLAIDNKNMSYCKPNDVDYLSKCYKDYAYQTHDLAGCFAIDSEYSKGVKDACVSNFAERYQEPGVCDSLSTLAQKIGCYGSIIIRNQTSLSLDKCAAVSVPEWKNKCYHQYAIQIKDRSVCEYVLDADEKARCANDAA